MAHCVEMAGESCEAKAIERNASPEAQGGAKSGMDSQLKTETSQFEGHTGSMAIVFSVGAVTSRISDSR